MFLGRVSRVFLGRGGHSYACPVPSRPARSHYIYISLTSQVILLQLAGWLDCIYLLWSRDQQNTSTSLHLTASLPATEKQKNAYIILDYKQFILYKKECPQMRNNKEKYIGTPKKTVFQSLISNHTVPVWVPEMSSVTCRRWYLQQDWNWRILKSQEEKQVNRIREGFSTRESKQIQSTTLGELGGAIS